MPAPKKMIFLLSMVALTLTTNSPFLLTFLLLSLSGMVGLFSGLTMSKWLFVSIFMIFLGGMMILFFYIVSLAKSVPNFFQIKLKYFMVSGCLLLFADILNTGNSFYLKDLYYYSGTQILFMLATYLFFCLVTVVKVSQSFKGSLTSAW